MYRAREGLKNFNVSSTYIHRKTNLCNFSTWRPHNFFQGGAGKNLKTYVYVYHLVTMPNFKHIHECIMHVKT